MANTRGKEVDTTSLSLDQAAKRGFIHRDYLAHCLRWSHVCSYLHEKRRYQTHHILDVGCGSEAPLPSLMFSSRLCPTTGSYTGVDYGKKIHPGHDGLIAAMERGSFKGQLLSGFDFAKDKLPREKYDTIVSFEVLEHVEPYHAYQLLKRMRQVLAPGGLAFISTPIYDPKMGAANNHVNEMSFHGLQALIYAAGLNVERAYGTFASQKDYKAKLTPGEREVFNKLGEYYDSNVLSCLMAPLVEPQLARNAIWILAGGKPVARDKKTMAELLKPEHSSSANWAAHVTKVMKEAARG